MVTSRVYRFLLFSAGTLLWLLAGGELLSRLHGNWRFDQLALTPRAVASPDPAAMHDAQRALVEDITYEKSADPAWFFLPPAEVHEPQSADLQARAKANAGGDGSENFVWNDAMLAAPGQDFVAYIRRQNVPTLFAFHSYDGSTYPRYRLYPGNDFTPTPWITNRWGWLGADTPMRKPPGTVRVGIVGDSTSHSLYGLHLQSFLGAWAKANGFDVRFEVFSIGRQGLFDLDELPAFKYELAPIGPDYVVRYFAPAFSLNRLALVDFADIPPVIQDSPDLSTPWRAIAHRLLDRPSNVSALARRVRDVATREANDSLLTEPSKPRVRLHMPAGTTGKVVLASARRDIYFKVLIDNLDSFKAIADSVHATPLVSTERLCAWEGMALSNGLNHLLYQAINGPVFWPLSYRDLRRMLSAHNSTVA